MLRVLGPTDLEGFVFQNPGAPKCELITGIVSKVQALPDAFLISVRGANLENGQKVMRVATVSFEDRGADRKMLRTRAIAAGIKNGVYISILSMQYNNRRIALDFKFSGLWRLKGYRGEINVLFGKYEDLWVQNNLVTFRFLEFNASRQRYYRRQVDIANPVLLKSAERDFSGSNKAEACICICGPERRSGSISSYQCMWYEMIESLVGFSKI